MLVVILRLGIWLVLSLYCSLADHCIGRSARLMSNDLLSCISCAAQRPQIEETAFFY